MADRSVRPTLVLAYWIADADSALGQDLCPQAAAMSESFDDLASGEPLQMIAGLAQANAVNLDIAYLKVPSHEMIKRYPACNHVASRLTRRKLEVIFPFESFNRFRLDQRKLAIRQRFRESSQTQSIAVAFEARTGDGESLVHRLSRRGSGRGDVDELHSSAVH